MKEIVSTNVDILLISESKLDSSFPRTQFHIHGFGEPYRFDRNGKGGGILLNIRDYIPSKHIELTCGKRNGFYAVLITQLSNHLQEIGKNLDLLSSKFDNYLLMGDFNAEPNEPAISDFCEIYNT